MALMAAEATPTVLRIHMEKGPPLASIILPL
jgi:hypothetical protein